MFYKKKISHIIISSHLNQNKINFLVIEELN